MRSILLTSDFHIADKFCLTQIERLLNQVAVLANQKDELWILGDVFHCNKVSSQELYLLVMFLKQIQVPTTIVVGNHDKAEGQYSILDWIPTVFPNVKVYNTSTVVQVEDLKVLLGHFNLEESKMGAYDFKLQSGLSIRDLEVKLACLGHIHKSQIIKYEDKTAVHPGSLFFIDYGEKNDIKGVVNLVVEGDHFTLTQLPLDPDPVIQIETTPDIDPNTLLGEYPSNTRVKIVINYSDPLLNKKAIISKYDKFTFRDKKIIFQFKTSREELTKRVHDSHQGLVQLEEYLKNLEPSVATLIRRYLGETKT